MPRMSIGQKAARVLQFMMGLRNPRVADSLSAHGFKNGDLAEGWAKMAALTTGRLDGRPVALDPTVLVALDTWENKWFPIANASLRPHFPEVHARVFRNLVQTDGPEVMISVGTFLNRLDELKSTETGKEALALLEKRGIGDTVKLDAKALLKKLETVDTTPSQPALTPEEEASREAALWDWYLEWSEIARAVITDRRQLRSLGFLDDSGRPVKDTGEEPVDDVTPVNVATPQAASLPAPSVPKKPHILGMPGGSPFIDEP